MDCAAILWECPACSSAPAVVAASLPLETSEARFRTLGHTERLDFEVAAHDLPREVERVGRPPHIGARPTHDHAYADELGRSRRTDTADVV
jgi:hypothetical protein